MPSVKIKTKAGSVNFSYTISTPTSTSAKKIDKNLPTIIFVHPVYIASSIFQSEIFMYSVVLKAGSPRRRHLAQFADAHLRRFNLVTLDLRSHGETGGKVTKSYGQEEAADDVIKFMVCLSSRCSVRLPTRHPVHRKNCASLPLISSDYQWAPSSRSKSP